MYLFLSHDESIHTYSNNTPHKFIVNLFQTLDMRDGTYEVGMTECHVICEKTANAQVLINCNLVDTSHVFGRRMPTLRHLYLESPPSSSSATTGVSHTSHHFTFDRVYYHPVIKGDFKDLSFDIESVRDRATPSINILSKIKAFNCTIHIRKKK